ncbi:MAG: S41 family peptidase [Pseudomonadota bacterium]|nr:S41 family peptidase [Pseudomonadota bacterium]
MDHQHGFRCALLSLALLSWVRIVGAAPATAEATPAPRMAAAAVRSNPADDFHTPSRVLTDLQATNLQRLGKVWGFLKYHHPSFTSGNRDADAELLRMLPSLLHARDSTSANAILLEWVDAQGTVLPCDPCARSLVDDAALLPRLQWLQDESNLGATLSSRLRFVHSQRRPEQQHYVSVRPKVGNAAFEHEPPHATASRSDLGFRILSVLRFWNIIEYWSPYRDLIDEDWDRVLLDSLRRVAAAPTDDDYVLELMALLARASDTHTNLWSAIAVRPPSGECQLPIVVRFIEGQPAVSAHIGGTPQEPRIRIGDVITGIDGADLTQQIKRWLPYYAGSNDASRKRDIGRFMSCGPCGEATIELRRGETLTRAKAQRLPSGSLDLRRAFDNDLRGESFRFLAPGIAYLNALTLSAGDAAGYLAKASDARGLIIDLRGYPREFVLFALASRLIQEPTAFARFTVPDLSNPGAFLWKDGPTLTPAQPRYAGKVVVLVDEATQSQAEYTAMALRAAPNTVIVGSTTAGADGNISRFPLPGALSAAISGIGVFYPNRSLTQRIGIVADVAAAPTLRGIAAGRDEVLEAGIREIAGGALSDAELLAISKAAVSGAR